MKQENTDVRSIVNMAMKQKQYTSMSNVSEFFFSLLCLFNECFAAVLKKGTFDVLAGER